MLNENSTFGFIGFGLIGASLAKCIRDLYKNSNIIAYNYHDKPNPSLEKAKKDGVLSSIITDIKQFCACDCIFLCAPVLSNIEYMSKLNDVIKEDTLITDVSSVKNSIMQAADKYCPKASFIGGHPMAGKEKTGYEHSYKELFDGCTYILTPKPDTPAEHLSWLKEFLVRIGANPVILDAAYHDEIAAAISHIPHVLSAAMVNQVSDKDKDGNYKLLSAGGFKDTTRISSSSPHMWRDICLTNKEAILDNLDDIEKILKDIRYNIEHDEADKISDYFKKAKEYRDNV